MSDDAPCCEDGPAGHTRQEHHDASPCYDQACPFDHPYGGPYPHPCDETCDVRNELFGQRCTREPGHAGWHWQETAHGVMVFGTAERPLTRTACNCLCHGLPRGGWSRIGDVPVTMPGLPHPA